MSHRASPAAHPAQTPEGRCIAWLNDFITELQHQVRFEMAWCHFGVRTFGYYPEKRFRSFLHLPPLPFQQIDAKEAEIEAAKSKKRVDKSAVRASGQSYCRPALVISFFFFSWECFAARVR